MDLDSKRRLKGSTITVRGGKFPVQTRGTPTDLSKVATALSEILFDHHRSATALHPPGQKQFSIKKYLISYGELCERAGVPHLTRDVGTYLGEVADWCAARGWPAINSLAVQADSRMPGVGYDGAGDGLCSLVNWEEEVTQCIRFSKYHEVPPTARQEVEPAPSERYNLTSMTRQEFDSCLRNLLLESIMGPRPLSHKAVLDTLVTHCRRLKAAIEQDRKKKLRSEKAKKEVNARKRAKHT